MLDRLDIILLLYLNDHGEVTTTEIAKNIFKPKDRRETVKLDNHVRSRLKALIKLGVVETITDGNTKYRLVEDRFFMGEGKVSLPIKGGKKMLFDIGDFIVVKTDDGNLYLRRLVKDPEDENNGCH